MSALATKERPAAVDAAERFPGDIATHVATIKHDDGLFRHIECRRPGTYCMGFNVTTWPGYLAITGDMGAFVFSRIDDMFAFFGADEGRVNLQYWAEKIDATDRNSGHKVFSPRRFRENVADDLREWLESWGDGIDATELRQRIHDEVLSRADDGAQTAIGAAMEFEHDGERIFQDFWDHQFDEYTYHYVWCCHAIVWAIAQYRKQRAALAPPVVGVGGGR